MGTIAMLQNADHNSAAPACNALVALLLAGSVLAQPAFAQDSGPASRTAATNTYSSDPGSPTSNDEILVTATRRVESARAVPITINTFTREGMDRQGIRQIQDLARFTPALNFVETNGVSGNNISNISIRGIQSDVGAATTAIYIDDTPIQIRNVGYFGGNPYPRVFDLDRVEVLKGPQGTTFGASSEGGAVRFITPQPSLQTLTVYGRSELKFTQNGSPSYEAGAAVGAPLVKDKIGLRVSAWAQHVGGYIDRINRDTGATVDKDANSDRTLAFKAALTFQPTEALAITPSIYYQKVTSNGRDQYFEGYGDKDDADYKSANLQADYGRDRFWIAQNKIDLDVGPVTFTSNTSYLDRANRQALDYTNFQRFNRTGNPFTISTNDIPSTALIYTNQKNFVQELRFSSNDQAAFLTYSGGLYYSNVKQGYQNFTGSGKAAGVLVRGVPQYLGLYSYYALVDATDRQYAAYATLDAHFTETLTLSGGARVTKNKFDYFEADDGPVNGGVRTTITNQQKETKVTPKATLSYRPDRASYYYASVSQGFRPGGAQPRVPTVSCATDLATLGITASPTTYDSDSLWSYEAGARKDLAGGRLRLDGSVYIVKWKNIQQSVRLPTCSFNFVANLGKATSKGVELNAEVRLSRLVRVGVNGAYNHTVYDETSSGGNGSILSADGEAIGGPRFTGNAFGQLDYALGRLIGGESKGYTRADFTWRSHGFNRDTRVYSYDPGLTGLPASQFVSVRTGIVKGGADISLFIDNVFNSSAIVARSHDGKGSPLYYDTSYRPRSYGLTAQFRL